MSQEETRYSASTTRVACERNSKPSKCQVRELLNGTYERLVGRPVPTPVQWSSMRERRERQLERPSALLTELWD
jgi:hypothetical protein